MKVAKSLHEITIDNASGTCVTIGNFDGMHAGHRKLIARTVQKATLQGLCSVVVTFDPHPLRVLIGQSAPPLIIDSDKKIALLKETGADLVLLLPFTKELAALEPEEFVRNVLVEHLHTRELVIGYDFSLGKARKGNAAMLRELGVEYGFGVERLNPVIVGDAVVSSTRIRDFVRSGDVWGAMPLLERFHELSGVVVHGMGRGSKMLGFATANIDTANELLPAPGVYATWVYLDGMRYLGVTNIGHNPTFGNDSLSIETHIVDFDRDIYGEHIRIAFVQRLRSEKRFDGIQDLVAQITSDVELARTILAAPEADR